MPFRASIILPHNFKVCSKEDLRKIKKASFLNYEQKYGIYNAIKQRAKSKEPFEDIFELMRFINHLYQKVPEVYKLNLANHSEIKGNNFIRATKSETLNLISNDKNSTVYFGQELFDFVYRGQSEDYTECLPSIFRSFDINKIDDVVEKLECAAKTQMFTSSIRHHPFIKILQAFRSGYALSVLRKHPDLPGTGPIYTKHSEDMINYINRYPLNINYTALAQHYGYKTNLLDVTTNLMIAALFAVTDFDHENSKIEITEKKDKGVIYVIPWWKYDDSPRLGGDFFDIIGWQPLVRTVTQQACILNMYYGDDLNTDDHIYKLYFKHNREKSRQLYNIWKDKIFGLDLYTKIVVENLKLFDSFSVDSLKASYNILQKICQGKVQFEFNELLLRLRNKDRVSDKQIILPEPNAIYSQNIYLSEYAELLNHVHYRRKKTTKKGFFMERDQQNIKTRPIWPWP